MKSEDLIVLVGVLAVVGVGGFFAVKALQAPAPAPSQSNLGSVLGQIGNTATAVQGLFD